MGDTHQTPPDDDLTRTIHAMARGDESALASLYDATHRAVFGLAQRLLSDAASAEEVVHDVYLQAWRTAERFDRRRGTPKAWLMVMTRSRSLDRLRSSGPRQRVERPLDAASDATADSADPSQPAVDDERASRVHAALALLPPQQRRVIELAYLSGLSHSEIARRLDEPLGTVKTRIRLAMRKLHDRLITMTEVA